jgi:hypothetical protein
VLAIHERQTSYGCVNNVSPDRLTQAGLAVRGEGCVNAETVMDDGLTLNIDIQGDQANHKPHLGWRERKKQVRMRTLVLCLLPGSSSSQGLTLIYTFVGS